MAHTLLEVRKDDIGTKEKPDIRYTTKVEAENSILEFEFRRSPYLEDVENMTREYLKTMH